MNVQEPALTTQGAIVLHDKHTRAEMQSAK